MADDNKNLAGEGERTSILPQAEPQVTDQTEVLPTHATQAQTAQLPPVTQQESAGAFVGTPLESVAGSSADDQAGDEAVAARAATGEPASKKTSWASARLSPVPQPQSSPSVSVRASSLMRPSWVMVRTSTSRATRTATTTRGTARRTAISAPAVSRSRVTASNRAPVTASGALAASRETLAVPARDPLRRVAEAPAASLEARAVRTPPPRRRERPPAER